MKPAKPDQEEDLSRHPYARHRWSDRLNRAKGLHLRDLWWRLLDYFEARRAARVTLYLAAFFLVVGYAAWFWGHPWWVKRNSIRLAREWMASGRLNYAAEAAQKAAAVDPTNPEPWEIAAELARLGAQFDLALQHARHAAQLAPEDPAVLTGWAAAALRAGETAEADRALDQIPVEAQAASPHVQRLRGELARRALRLTAARSFFTAARDLEGPLAVNEVPLGLILLNATDPAERSQGLALLEKWTADRTWGATALRMLLEDALTRQLPAAMRQYAEALRAHPGCTLADMPRCLLALARADEPHYRAVLTELQTAHALTPAASAQLISWLNEIGRGADAVAWIQTLPQAAMQRPPLVVVTAEALRQARDWPALQTWTADKDWGPEATFLSWTYGLQAAAMLGETLPAEQLLRSLVSHARLNGVHGLFAASLLYSWGREPEAENLWWILAGQEGQIAIDALGSLARHFQVRHDAEGQYRVFRQLHLLRPQDEAIGNNFAFFALLTGREQRLATETAANNLQARPDNPVYRATSAFALLMRQQPGDALALLRSLPEVTRHSPAVAFAYGLALAGTGHKDEARLLLGGLPPDTLTGRERELIRSALAD